MKAPVFIALATCLALAGCISDYCDNPYTTSEVWLANGTSEPMYYTFSNKSFLTPDCTVQKMPLKLAYILDFRKFRPVEVMGVPTYTANQSPFSYDEDYYRYLLLLRYDNTVVACYDVKRATLAQADYPWFSEEPDKTEVRLDELYDCDKPETTYIYTYYITDSIL